MLNDKIKNSLYNAVEKYFETMIELNEESRNDVKRIVSIAKKLGFSIENRKEKYGLDRLFLHYDGQWILYFYIKEDGYHNKTFLHAELNQNELLTGQALIDYNEFRLAEAAAEIEAERRMSLYNSGYRDF